MKIRIPFFAGYIDLSPEPRDPSRYEITNIGSLRVCPKALSESGYFQRLVEASRRCRKRLAERAEVSGDT